MGQFIQDLFGENLFSAIWFVVSSILKLFGIYEATILTAVITVIVAVLIVALIIISIVTLIRRKIQKALLKREHQKMVLAEAEKIVHEENVKLKGLYGDIDEDES